jgi:hypothetical protein
MLACFSASVGSQNSESPNRILRIVWEYRLDQTLSATGFEEVNVRHLEFMKNIQSWHE